MPADLRSALGISSANFFTSRYLGSDPETPAVELPFRVREVELTGARTSSSVQNMEGSSSIGTDGDVRSPGFSGKRILLVEDNELNQEVAHYVLAEQGFEVDTANDGSVAVKLVKEKGLLTVLARFGGVSS